MTHGHLNHTRISTTLTDVIISTEPYMLIDRADQSPFNVTPPVELRTFPREALDTLNERYGNRPSLVET